MPSPPPSSLAAALLVVSRALRDLDAAGGDGFEGLMKDVLVELTGAGFHLAKSGPQGGSDMRNLATDGVAIGLEAKRYQPNTRLPLDQLKAKLVDAADQSDPIDVWVLAATRSISINDREALHQLGDRLGLKVIVYDWPGGRNPYPDLAVLLAATPLALAAHLGGATGVAEAFDEIRSHPAYEATRLRLTGELLAADVGFTAAVRASERWLDDAQTSEANARSRLGGFNDLKSARAVVARRPTLFDRLKAWWGGDAGTVALLGDEGVGKTWTALGWLDSDEGPKATGPAPIVLFISARDADGRDPEALLARALLRNTGLRDEAFWRRRLQLWKTASTSDRILLIIDGLNQNWSKVDWADLLQSLFEDAWSGRVRVLVTCWPDTWEALGALAPLTPAPLPLTVGPFTEAELDDFLAGHGRSREDFTRLILELMTVPRLSLLALTHREELEGSGDVTAERLAYEDWKHRLRRGSASQGFSDAEFKDFVAELGNELARTVGELTVTRRDLLERLGRDSGAHQTHLSVTLADLVAGRWFEPGDRPNRFRLNRSLAPYALGLALAAEVRGLKEEEEAKARIAEFLDPFKGQSLGVAAIRAAATAGLLDPAVGRSARRALIGRWLSEQNFGRVDFDAWWRVMGSDIHLFCDLAESWWLDRANGGGLFVDEILIKGFANASDFEDVARELRRRISRWLGWVWPEPEQGRLNGLSLSLGFETDQRRRVTSNLEAWSARADGGAWPEIELRDSGDVSWLSHRVFGIISYVKVAPFAQALVAWALSRSILEEAHHFEELAWLLRLNDRDRLETRAAVHEAVNRLAALNAPLAARGAVWLLQALGDEASAARSLTLAEAAASPVLYDETFWSPWMIEEINPASTIEPVTASIDGARLWRGSEGLSEDDHRLDMERLPLARTDPGRLRDILGEAALSAPTRSDSALDGLISHVPDLLLVLTDAERIVVADAIAARLDAGSPEEASTVERWRAAETLLRVWLQPAVDQFEILQATGFDGALIGRVRHALRPPTTEEKTTLIGRLPASGTPDVMATALGYARELDLAEEMGAWAPLEGLVLHEDPDVRRSALNIAARSHHAGALRAFADSGWASTEDTPREDRGYGSAALSVAADFFAEPGLLDRADPEIFGWRLYEDPDDIFGLDGLSAFLKAAVHDLDRPGERSFPRMAWNLEKPLKILVDRRLPEVLEWLDPWLADRTSVSIFSLHESFPVIDLTKVLIQAVPDRGLALWRLLKAAERDGIFKNRDIRLLPLFARDTAFSPELEVEVLTQVKTDDEIRGLAWFAMKHERDAWLADLIRRDVASEDPARQARGWRLLGFTDAVEPFETLWRELEPPSKGWLGLVRTASRALYDRNVWTRRWYADLLEASSPAEAYAAFQLLKASMDNRVGVWLKADFSEAPQGEGLEAYWSVMRKTLEKGLKEGRDQLSAHLFGQQIMKYTQAPWL